MIIKLDYVKTIESFRSRDEDNYEYEIFSTLSSARVQTNVILAGKRDSCRQINIRSFIILLSGEGLTSFSINNHTNFFGRNLSKLKLSGSYSFSSSNLKLSNITTQLSDG